MTATFHNMAREFTDFDQATLPAIPSHWIDNSWHNDTCPSFIIRPFADGVANVQVFIDYADEKDSWSAFEHRFAVFQIDADGEMHDECHEFSDWSAALKWIAALEETQLVEEFQTYCTKHGLPQLSADELLAELLAGEPADRSEQTLAHCDWLQAFIDRWNVAVEGAR